MNVQSLQPLSSRVSSRVLAALSALVVAAFWLGTPASAQITSLENPLPQDAQAALTKAQGAAKKALDTYNNYRPDQPLFRQAIRLGRQAVELAPENPETLRFLAEVYGVTGFYGPAFSIWQRFTDAGGSLDSAARSQIAQTGTQDGYARYSQGDLKGALSAYRTVTKLVPGSVRAQRWTGRILLEQNRPKAALPYWRHVQKSRPDDAGAKYFVTLAEAGTEHGLPAARAFYGGVSNYEAGRKAAAERGFSRATELNPGYAAAWGYLGRLAFETGEFGRAETAYSRASQLIPKNQTYRYFLGQAKARQTPAGQTP